MNDFENQEKNKRIFVPASEIIGALDRELTAMTNLREGLAMNVKRAERKMMIKRMATMIASPIFEGFLYGLVFSGLLYWILISL
jgi:hypothetical protein